jgi:hypothetical protein
MKPPGSTSRCLDKTIKDEARKKSCTKKPDFFFFNLAVSATRLARYAGDFSLMEVEVNVGDEGWQTSSDYFMAAILHVAAVTCTEENCIPCTLYKENTPPSMSS